MISSSWEIQICVRIISFSSSREENNIDDRHTLNVQMIAMILWWLPWSCDDGDLFPTAAISDSCPKCSTGVTPALVVQLHVSSSVIATLLNRSHFASRFFRLFVCNNSPTSRFQYFSLKDSSQSCRIELQRTQYFYSRLSPFSVWNWARNPTTLSFQLFL